MDNKVNYLLRLGDNAMVLSQRLCELCGKGPALEEDMALSNVSLDLLGQTRMWYTYAAELEGAGRDEDRLAYLRDAHDFKNVLLVEQPNGNYAHTLVRQFFFDTWHYFLIGALTRSSDQRIAEIAEKSLKEDLSPAPQRRPDCAPGRRHRNVAPVHADCGGRTVDVYRRGVQLRRGRRCHGGGRRCATGCDAA